MFKRDYHKKSRYAFKQLMKTQITTAQLPAKGKTCSQMNGGMKIKEIRKENLYSRNASNKFTKNNGILKNPYLAYITVINSFKQESSMYAKGAKVEE